ncbi:uncharacterized protein LOC131659423 [Vicia villosa]|uniref:uncharacterized protein LOC131659423 n=1 Tax=Vicia villosa TaxID=3911 RepID=UPI00273B15B8|nr:uncharacterized protein LOC131659423 [Vicia villosa]
MEYYLYYRSWMYDRLEPGRRALKPNFVEGVDGFIKWAFVQECCRSEGGVRCPCLKCECRRIISDPEEVTRHLHRRGFIKDYWVWTSNGENLPMNVPETSNTHASSSRPTMEYEENFNMIGEMVEDAFGVNVAYDQPEDFDGEELPNEEAQRFYQLLNEMNIPLFEGSSDSKLSMCRGLCVVIKTKPIGHIETDDIVEDLAYQVDEVGPINDVIAVGQITNLSNITNEGYEVDASVLLVEDNVNEEHEGVGSEDSITSNDDNDMYGEPVDLE